MITVAEALEKVLALVGPLGAECVPLRQAAGRILAEPCVARRDQPPFRQPRWTVTRSLKIHNQATP